MIDDAKLCTKCNKLIWDDDFPKDSRLKSGYQSICKVCHSSQQKQWRKIHPPNYRMSDLKRNFGMAIEEYDMLMKKQSNVCAICQDVCGSGKRLAVDHNHQTGRIRGLLCNQCNHMLGLARDNSDRLLRASNYLEGIAV